MSSTKSMCTGLMPGEFSPQPFKQMDLEALQSLGKFIYMSSSNYFPRKEQGNLLIGDASMMNATPPKVSALAAFRRNALKRAHKIDTIKAISDRRQQVDQSLTKSSIGNLYAWGCTQDGKWKKKMF